MKKFYSFLVIALLSVIGFSASAITVTVKAQHPEIIDMIKQGAASDMNEGNGTKLNFSEEGTVNDFTPNSWYVRLYPKADYGNVKFTMKAYDSAGTLRGTIFNNKAAGTAAYMQTTFMTWSSMDGGTIEITDDYGVAVEPDCVTVFIDGDPAEVMMSFAGVPVTGLKAGQNKVELKNKVVEFRHVPDSKYFYEFLYNGNKKNHSTDQAEGGNKSYYYLFTSAKANDSFYINTVWPETKVNVSIATNDNNGFITDVTVDGSPVENWEEGFQVDPGQEVRIVGDRNGYLVNSMSLNDVVNENFHDAIAVTANSDDLNFYFDVTPLVRDKSFTISAASDLKFEINTHAGGYTMYSKGSTATIEYCDAELPIVVSIGSESQSKTETRVPFVYKNDEFQFAEVSTFRLNTEVTRPNELVLNSGDVFRFDYNKSYFFVNTNGNADKVIMDVTGDQIAITDGAQVSTKEKSNGDNYVSFQAVEGWEIVSIKVDGEVSDNAPVDGVYTFGSPRCLSEYEIDVRIKPEITIFAEGAENLFMGGMVIIGEYDMAEVYDGKNVINISEFELDEDSQIMFATNLGEPYFIESISYNGYDATGDEDYFMGGAYYFPISAGDKYNVVVKPIVRDQKITVYISGASNAPGARIAEVTGNQALCSEMADGYSEFYIHSTDNPLNFQWNMLLSANATIYVNDNIVDDLMNIVVADGDVIKAYFTDEEPEPIGIVYGVNGSAERPIVTTDHCRLVDFSIYEISPFAEGDEEEEEPVEDTATCYHFVLPGTHVAVAAPAGEKINNVKVNGSYITPDANGEYSFEAQPNEDNIMTIEVFANNVITGVEGIIAGSADSNAVYNLQGIRVDAASLPAGIYVKAGKKFVVK